LNYKAAVLGVAEMTTVNQIDECNSIVASGSSSDEDIHSQEMKGMPDKMFDDYLKSKLDHLTEQDRKVMEPVLRQYKNNFYVEGYNEFQATDLIEHSIDAGQAKPIRKRPYRVPHALREEVHSQVQDLLKKGIIEESASPWSAPSILVRKKSPDHAPRYRLC
jgi:hypothetical protein